jgi:HlyD family secretion protein
MQRAICLQALFFTLKGLPMKKLAIAITLGVIVTVALIFFAVRGNSSSPYKTDKAAKGDIRSACIATGTVNPTTTVLVGTQVSGRIKELYADFNSPVTKGQLIALIDPAPFESQLEQARANLLSAQAGLAKAQATLKDSERNVERKRQLFASKVIGKSEIDAEETSNAVAKAQVGLAEAQVVQAVASYKLAETNLQYTKIISPVDGIVISRNVDIGQTMAAMFQSPTLFSIAQDLSKMQINTNVDESDIGRIQPGQDAEFVVDAYPETVFTGKVTQVRNAPVVVQNVVTYDVVITVANPDLRLKPGMTANVSIITGVKNNVLRVPNAALRFKPKKMPAGAPGEHGQKVWLPDGDEAKPVKVTTGITDGSWSELLDGAITEGQEVIVGLADKEKK